MRSHRRPHAIRSPGRAKPAGRRPLGSKSERLSGVRVVPAKDETQSPAPPADLPPALRGRLMTRRSQVQIPPPLLERPRRRGRSRGRDGAGSGLPSLRRGIRLRELRREEERCRTPSRCSRPIRGRSRSTGRLWSRASSPASTARRAAPRAPTRASARCQDCSDACIATGRILSRQTELEPRRVRAIVEACAQACAACAEECESHAGHHEHCRVCAEACRRCEDACRTLLSALAA